MYALHLHIQGIVQGVGFRPYVYRLAGEYGLKGWVNNTPDGVHIEIAGEERKLKEFTENLKKNPPEHARITSFYVQEIEGRTFGSFSIVESSGNEPRSVLMTPDYAICDACEKELFTEGNRRFRYPFITCTHCGPRYSIIDALPYDRENTTMDHFIMCDDCRREYDDIGDRRYYSQTNSCEKCGISIHYHSDEAKVEGQEDILQRIKADLSAGQILAVKGIGGYLLMCDATNPEAVALLRKRKGRPSKPFALIYPNQEMVSEDVIATEKEWAEYYAPSAPIVLFRMKDQPASGIDVAGIAPGLDRLGIMRPCAPLLSMIVRDFGKPLIATSGNLSGSPIIFEDSAAIESLSWIADAVISHDRRILVPEDDSVIKFSARGNPVIIRRSRGVAPNYFGSPIGSGEALLSMGASLKSTFALQHGQNTYVSQYLGDQDSFDTQESYRKTLDTFMGVLDFHPEKIVADLHPQYASTLIGRKMSQSENIPLVQVQHHEAHFAAVLGENGLLDADHPVLGVIWDGTGYGHDANIWGGEFFSYSDRQIRRIDHFDYFTHLVGDKMPREPRLSALSILHDTVEAERLRNKFTAEEWSYYHKLLRHEKLMNSSVGRLFDAAACVLDLGDRISYEGEAAVALECLAGKAVNMKRKPIDTTRALSPVYHLLRMISFLHNGATPEEAAWQFHSGLVDTIRFIADIHGFRHIAFSGGVFQNTLLTDLIEERLDKRAKLYFHKEFSPNDESISFGQLVYVASGLKSEVSQEVNTMLEVNI